MKLDNLSKRLRTPSWAIQSTENCCTTSLGEFVIPYFTVQVPVLLLLAVPLRLYRISLTFGAVIGKITTLISSNIAR